MKKGIPLTSATTAKQRSQRNEIPPGTLDMLILRTLARGKQHGYEIAKSIQAASGDVLGVKEGSLYPALGQMLARRWISCKWGNTGRNHRARFYWLTELGQRSLTEEIADFLRVTDAIQQVLDPNS